MTDDPVLDMLLRLSVQKLRTMQHDIDTQISDLQTSRAQVERALARKDSNGASTGTAATRRAATRVSARKRSVSTNDLILGILAERPGYVWMPAEIIREVHARGNSTADAAVRVALRRMSERPNAPVTRGPDGTGWKLASSNGSGRESSSEAHISGLGEHGGHSSLTDDPSPGLTILGFEKA